MCANEPKPDQTNDSVNFVPVNLCWTSETRGREEQFAKRGQKEEEDRGVSLASQDYSEPFFACTARTLRILIVHQ